MGDGLATDFAAALDDDLDAPRAVARLFDAVREGNRLLDQGVVPAEADRAAWFRAMDAPTLPATPGLRSPGHRRPRMRRRPPPTCARRPPPTRRQPSLGPRAGPVPASRPRARRTSRKPTGSGTCSRLPAGRCATIATGPSRCGSSRPRGRGGARG
ncbi:MAG: hypothetical protein IPK12_20400 [Gemmatimonadetes bacterium]|nr:hypothetical protein [Gemmatimonadota bacterium]